MRKALAKQNKQKNKTKNKAPCNKHSRELLQKITLHTSSKKKKK